MGRKRASEKRRESLAHTVEEYVALLPEEHQQAMSAFRSLIKRTLPQATETLEWGLPVYEFHGRLCYVKRFPTFLQIGFWRGSELPQTRFLSGEGEKMRHVRLRRAADLERIDLEAILRSAGELNKHS